MNNSTLTQFAVNVNKGLSYPMAFNMAVGETIRTTKRRARTLLAEALYTNIGRMADEFLPGVMDALLVLEAEAGKEVDAAKEWLMTRVEQPLRNRLGAIDPHFHALELPIGEAGTLATFQDWKDLYRELKASPNLLNMLRKQGANVAHAADGAELWALIPKAEKARLTTKFSKLEWGSQVLKDMAAGKVTALLRYALPALSYSMFYLEDRVQFLSNLLSIQQEKLNRLGSRASESAYAGGDDMFMGEKLGGSTVGEQQESRIEIVAGQLDLADDNLGEMTALVNRFIALAEASKLEAQFAPSRTTVFEKEMGVFKDRIFKSVRWDAHTSLEEARAAYKAARIQMAQTNTTGVKAEATEEVLALLAAAKAAMEGGAA